MRSTPCAPRSRSAPAPTPRLDRAVTDLDASLVELASAAGADAQRQARRLTERLALALAGVTPRAALAAAAVADAFCATRLAGDHGVTFGTLPAGVDTARDPRPRLAHLTTAAPFARSATRLHASAIADQVASRRGRRQRRSMSAPRERRAAGRSG